MLHHLAYPMKANVNMFCVGVVAALQDLPLANLDSIAWVWNRKKEKKNAKVNTNKRVMVTGEDQGRLSLGNYFRIVAGAAAGNGIYQIQWCPTEVCSICRFICGTAGGLVENGKRLLALNGSVLPVTFEMNA